MRIAAAKAVQAAANDNAPIAPDASPADLVGLQLVEAMRRLKDLQSVEKKVELKRQLFPAFQPYVDGVLAASAEAGHAPADDVVGTMMVWAIDVGDYGRALQIGDHLLRFGLALPGRFNRKPAVLLAEEIADAALSAIAAKKPFPPHVLADVERITGGSDMPDEVKARLFKAIGLDYLRAADEEAGDQAVAGLRTSALNAALGALRRALELNERVGVKKEIERLERELKKSEAQPPASETGNP